MTPVMIGGATLYCGACEEVLPLIGKVDAVITDPPYGIDYENAGGFCESSGWTKFEKLGWDKVKPERAIFEQLIAISRVQVIWGGNYFTDSLPPTMQWLVWDKGQRNFTLADCEFAWSSQNRAARIFNYARALALKDGKQHPTQKPIALMAWCIEQVKPNPQLILDPFLGSGTTGVAAIQLGRKFIGIEREPKYFEIACRRIEQAVAQGQLFAPEPMKQDQSAMFAEAS
ncbi:MAG: site-specific DNA-methyltransferase [Telluria sp.]